MKTAKQHNAELCGEVQLSKQFGDVVNKPPFRIEKDTGHADDYKAASIGRVGSNRMSLGIPAVPHPEHGDMVNYARLAELTLKVWSDLIRLKSSVHAGYHKTLQMTGEERAQVMVLGTRINTIERVINEGPSA